MELPIVAPAPVVANHARVFRDLFESPCQCRSCQHDLAGLIVLPHKSLADIARCLFDSANKMNLSRFLSEAPWREEAVNRRRIRYMRQQTKAHHRRRRDSLMVSDDTLYEHGGSRLDDVDRHDHHGDGTYSLAHHPVTSFSVSAYRLRSADAIGQHWCLVFVASSLLHLTCLPAVPNRTPGLIHTMGEAVGGKVAHCCSGC